MGMPHRFDWHDAKAAKTETERGITFGFASRVFLDPARIDFDVSRPEEGEERRKAVGLIDGRLYTVVYTMRGDVTWLISARRAKRRRNGNMARFTLDPRNPPRLTPAQEARQTSMTEAEIEAIAASDPDNPPSTEEELDRGVFGRRIRLLRERLGLSQSAFAERVRDWEQGRRMPDAAMRAYLTVIEHDADTVRRALEHA